MIISTVVRLRVHAAAAARRRQWRGVWWLDEVGWSWALPRMSIGWLGLAEPWDASIVGSFSIIQHVGLLYRSTDVHASTHVLV